MSTLRWTALLALVACNAKPDPGAPPDLPGTPSLATGSPTTPTTGYAPTGEVPAAPRPPDPTFPTTIDHLSIAVRTGDGTFDGTDDNTLSVCLTATDCFGMNAADVDDFQVGGFDVYHFDSVGLDRALVDRVEIRSVDGNNLWRPACLELRFDGEPVYCRPDPGDGVGFGIEADELQSWVDPEGLHNACTTCYPTTLTHGPMLGAITTDTVRVWARTDATRTVGLRLDRDADLSDAPVVAWVQPSPHDDYTGTLLVEDVPGGTWHYGVEVDGVLLEQDLLSLAPTTPGPRKIAMGSCAKLDQQPIFALIDAMDVDALLMLGDNHYANSADLESLRWFYRWSLDRPFRRDLLTHTPTVATWDDHDYVGNNTDGTAAGKDTALRAFGEYWANESVGAPGTPGVFSRWRWGDVEVFLVDDRYYRGLNGDFLGAAQTTWLVDAMASSDATFKLLACGSRWTEVGSSDSWAEFLPARDALFAELAARNVQGIVLLSGDIHRSELRWIARAEGYDLLEVTSSPLANVNSPCNADAPLACFDTGPSYVLLDIDTAAADPRLTATIYDAAGAPRASAEVVASQLR